MALGRGRALIVSAATLLTLVGLLWVLHGVGLLVDAQTAMAGISAGPSVTRATAVAYLVVGGCLLGAAAAAFLRRQSALVLGVASALLFAVDGFIANQVLFDTSRLPHDTANVVLATLIIFFLVAGRKAARPRAEPLSGQS